MLAGGLLSLLHGVVTIHFQADQVVSGLALTLLGVGLARVLGEGLSKAGTTSLLPTITVPGLSLIPVIGPIFFTNQSVLAYVGYLLVPVAWYWIHRTRPGLHLRAVGEYPTAADAHGRQRLPAALRCYVFIGGLLAGLAGASITLAIQPGWFSDLTVGGRGWIAVGLVIFARWDPIRAALGGYLFASITRFLLDVQGPRDFFGIPNPIFFDNTLTYLLGMLPYALVIGAVIVGSREATRKRIGAPAALGIPYIRGERGA